jgi:UPF0755 protein
VWKNVVRAAAVAAGLVVVAALVLFAWGYATLYAVRELPARETTVIIAAGMTAAETARHLQDAGVVRSARAFEVAARLRHDEAKLRAGAFRFAPHRTVDEVLRQIASGSGQVAEWVTFPEGFTVRQIAATLADRGLGDEAALDRAFLDGHIVVDGVRTRSLEGFLFPSTYLVPLDASPADIVRQMTDAFRRALPPDAAARAKRLHVRVVDAVTLASLIEREAKADDERRLMAGVYYNRLRLQMPLQVDATIEYTFPEHKTVITRADLASESPYNTYTHLGLPPTPIANPGHASLVAALDPQPSQFLYYVYRGNGHHAFARTLAEHDANVARYLH